MEAKCVKTIVLFRRKRRDTPNFIDFGGVTLTISAACAQKWIAVDAPVTPPRNPNTEEKPPEPLQ